MLQGEYPTPTADHSWALTEMHAHLHEDYQMETSPFTDVCQDLMVFIRNNAMACREYLEDGLEINRNSCLLEPESGWTQESLRAFSIPELARLYWTQGSSITNLLDGRIADV